MAKTRYREEKFENEGYAKKNKCYGLADVEGKNKIARKEAKAYKLRKQKQHEDSQAEME